MSNENEVGTFDWAMAQVDRQNAERERIRLEQEAQPPPEPDDGLPKTLEEAIAEIKSLREELASVQEQLDDLQSQINRLYRGGDW